MSAPKRIWVNVYPVCCGGSVAHESETAAKANCTGNGTTHEYRLVTPKRELLAYLVKKGELYADGGRDWVKERSKAFRFMAPDYGPKPSRWRDGARLHAETFSGARVVRLVRKARP